MADTLSRPGPERKPYAEVGANPSCTFQSEIRKLVLSRFVADRGNLLSPAQVEQDNIQTDALAARLVSAGYGVVGPEVGADSFERLRRVHGLRRH